MNKNKPTTNYENLANYAKIKENIFTVIHFKKGESTTRVDKNSIYLVFLLSGELLVSYGHMRSACLHAGHLFLLPAHLASECTAVEDTTLLLCLLETEMPMGPLRFFQHIRDHLEHTPVLNQLPPHKRFLCSLTYNEHIAYFLKFLQAALYTPINDPAFQELKREELLMYLRTHFSIEELAFFFAPIICNDPEFKDFVYANYSDIRDVKAFADRANMSVRNFSRKFKDNFHDTAQNWLIARKAEAVLYDIIHTTLSFTEIAGKHEFSTSAYLTNFCKNHYGKTPATLRKHGKIDL